MDWFKLFYELFGGLAIFFFGMKNLSDSLQAISGQVIKKVINSLTSNPIIAVLVGLIVTTIVQSSSITTVMVVGFVNAGLMSLTQAIGVILGANIGTTITGWIIAIKVGKYSMLLLAIGILPMLFSKNEKVSGWGRVLFATGLVFLGLQFMSDAFKPLRTNGDFLQLVTYFSAGTYLSLAATIGIGCILTFIIQSSSAMLGITIALAMTGSITFQTGAALVLGENIGTTITAILAGVSSNTSGKRAALAHALFNVLGVAFIYVVFWRYVHFIDWLVGGDPDLVLKDGSKPNIASHIAAGHTVFNIVNTIVFLPFISILSKVVTKLIPSTEKQPKNLEFLGSNLTTSPELGIIQAHLALIKMGDMIESMLEWTRLFLNDPSKVKYKDKILKYEDITDKINLEIMIFLGHVIQSPLSSSESSSIKSILSISDEMESIADYCQKVSQHLCRQTNGETILDPAVTAELNKLMEIVQIYYGDTFKSLKDDQKSEDGSQLEQQRLKFLELAERTRENQLALVKNEKVDPLTFLTVSDITLGFSRLVSHTRKIHEANNGKNTLELD